MKRIPNEKGQALILITFAAIVLFGFTALAIDGGRAFSDKRHVQNAADTAVLAAALSKARGHTFSEASAVAIARAVSNGYANDSDSSVQVNLCSDSGVTCEGLPAGATTSEYIRVKITSTIPTTFARVIRRNTFTNTAEAIAHVEGAASSTGGTLFGGAAMVATKTGNYNQCFLMNGGAMVYTHNSGVFINCSGSQALFMNGGAHLDMDANGQVVGCNFDNGGAVHDPITCGVAQRTLDAAYFATFPTTQAPPACPANVGSVTGSNSNTKMTGSSANVASGDTGTFNPGLFQDITINGSGARGIFRPGVYCISGNFNLNGNTTMQDSGGGRVVFILQDQNIVMNGGSAINFADLEIYGRNASFLLNGNAVFHASRMRIFSTGTGTFTVNGGSTLSSENAYFYLYRGNIVWNGNSILNLHAAPQGDPFGGLLVHMPWGNTNNVTLNGGSDIHIVGTFLAPQCPITFNGGVNFELHSQIIGYTYIVNGNADVDIYFIPSENYQPPVEDSPSIELTK